MVSLLFAVNADEVKNLEIILNIEPKIIAKETNPTTNVVNLGFCSSCLSAEENEVKETLGEVDTKAQKRSLYRDLF